MDKCSKCDNEANHSGMCDKHYLEMVGGSADEYKIQSLIAQIKAIPWAPWVKWIYMHNTGVWSMSSEEPLRSITYWHQNGRYSAIYDLILPAHPDWTQSKIRVND